MSAAGRIGAGPVVRPFGTTALGVKHNIVEGRERSRAANGVGRGTGMAFVAEIDPQRLCRRTSPPPVTVAAALKAAGRAATDVHMVLDGLRDEQAKANAICTHRGANGAKGLTAERVDALEG